MAKTLPTTLAVIAGGGEFPERVATSAQQKNIDVFVVHLAGFSNGFSGYQSVNARPEQWGFVFNTLRARGIKDIVLIGRMKRPHLLQLRPDLTTLCLLPRLLWALMFGGDDALLRAVRSLLEGQGFTLHAAPDFVDGLAAPSGVMGHVHPNDTMRAEIDVGLEAARAHGLRDLGQAVIVKDGGVIAYEDKRGTDAMITDTKQAGCILVKCAKPGQDRALDLPSIGPDTLRLCAQAGYAGIAVEAGTTLMLARAEMISLADANGLFLIGV